MCSAIKRGSLLGLILCFLLTFSCFDICAAPNIIYQHTGKGQSKRIALTFDDGPHPRYTPQILDILAEYGVEATFFSVGSNAEYYPNLISRILAEGHEIGNHTYHHYHTANMKERELREDIIACADALRRLTGETPHLFRPPEGVFNEGIEALCAREGYTIVMWSIDTRDWAHTPVEEIVKNVRENAKDGAIILMHDFIGKNSPTPAALRQIIPMLQESGYEFVTVSRLLEG
ncbi:MAG: polysaccharide deacetylase family protein [Clostridia bacterium]|nr:polysaccharide deacetylase family protein [Clostridia bacterium]